MSRYDFTFYKENDGKGILPILIHEEVNFDNTLEKCKHKINEMIEHIPRNYPVLFLFSGGVVNLIPDKDGKVSMRINGELMINSKMIEVDEEIDLTYTTGKFYINIFIDEYRPVIKVSRMYMEKHWCTLYTLERNSVGAFSAVFNDIYAKMHNNDDMAHFELFEKTRKYIDDSVDNWFKNKYGYVTIFDKKKDGWFKGITMPENWRDKYKFLEVYMTDYTNGAYYSKVLTKNFPVNSADTKFDFIFKHVIYSTYFDAPSIPIRTLNLAYDELTNRLEGITSHVGSKYYSTPNWGDMTWGNECSTIKGEELKPQFKNIGETKYNENRVVPYKICLSGFDWIEK